MTYVDGFVLAIPTAKIDEYRKMAEAASKVWIKHGALAYKECIGDDMEDKGFCATFPDTINLKDDETAVFAFIIYKSREHRDEVNARVMEDPELKCDPENMPFDAKRMAYGGFRTIVEANAVS